jgi:hypothetical protein
VKMGRRVILIEHTDNDAEKRRQNRHSSNIAHVQAKR